MYLQRNFFQFFVGIFFLVIAQLSVADEVHTTHGFIVLGGSQTHIYHLAKFNSPHQFQGIFEVNFQNSNGDEIDISKLRTTLSRNAILSLVSTDRFDSQTLGDDKEPFSFRGDLFEGYARSSAKKLIMRNVQVIRIKTEYFREIHDSDPKNSETKLILFCDQVENRYFAAHVVAGAPSFEELISINAIGRSEPFGPSPGTTLYPCSPGYQGSLITIANSQGDHPLEDLSRLRVFASGDSFDLFGADRVLLDPDSVNGSLHERNLQLNAILQQTEKAGSNTVTYQCSPSETVELGVGGGPYLPIPDGFHRTVIAPEDQTLSIGKFTGGVYGGYFHLVYQVTPVAPNQYRVLEYNENGRLVHVYLEHNGVRLFDTQWGNVTCDIKVQ